MYGHLETFGKRAAIWLRWAILRLFTIECTRSVVENKRYSREWNSLPAINNRDNIDQILKLAEATYAKADQRSDTVTDKCKSLLTISSMLLPFVGLIATQTAGPWLFIFPGLFFFIATYLMLGVLDIHNEMMPSLDEKNLQHPPDKFKETLAIDYLRSARFNDAGTDYRVTVLTAARWSLLLGLFVLAVVAPIAITVYPKVGTPVLQGPQGSLGVQGPQGR